MLLFPRLSVYILFDSFINQETVISLCIPLTRWYCFYVIVCYVLSISKSVSSNNWQLISLYKSWCRGRVNEQLLCICMNSCNENPGCGKLIRGWFHVTICNYHIVIAALVFLPVMHTLMVFSGCYICMCISRLSLVPWLVSAAWWSSEVNSIALDVLSWSHGNKRGWRR